MEQDLQDEIILKKYLLGEIAEDAALTRLEEHLMVEESLLEQLEIIEDELIDDYLDDSLSDEEKKRFERHFLALPERREKLEFTRALRRHIQQERAAQSNPATNERRPSRSSRSFFAFSALKVAVVILLVLGGGFLSWRFFFFQSYAERGTNELRALYRDGRPLKARLTEFDYAPFSNDKRGANQEKANSTARERAALTLLEGVRDEPGANSHHALGRYYLTQKEFEKAIAELEQALQLKPENAQAHSDLGAALFEASKKATGKNGETSLELIDKSLQHLGKAIELNSKLLEPRFNRALALEAASLPDRAKEAWNDYLQLDSGSQWAEEARRHLQMLESEKPRDLSANELENAFLAAFRRKDDEDAWQLLSHNREPIREKYLPQRLAMSLVAASGAQQAEFLQAMIYAGELEKRRINDEFAADIARFYANVSPPDLEFLREAQSSVQKGYKLCLGGEFTRARTELERARELFLKVNDVWEARLVELFVVYCLFNTDQKADSLILAEQITNFCEQKNYKWLLSNTLYWVVGGQRAIGQRTKAAANDKYALGLAEEIGDTYMYQRILISLARQSNFAGQKRIALDYLKRALEANSPQTSGRQRWRNYSDGIEILAKTKLYSLAKDVAIENIQLTKDLNDSLFVIYSQIDAGVVHRQAEDFAEAEKWLTQAKSAAEAVGEEAEKKSLLAQSLVELGHLERKLNNYEQAAEFYDQALAVVENAETPSFLYEIKKSRLLVSLFLNREEEIEKQIPETVKLAEKYREQILEEQERSSFFDNEQTIYDVAVANEFNHARYERAYDYLESSNSRSLLDWLQKGATVREERRKIEITFKGTAKPLGLDEIRAQMPERAQILQYAVLENKVLIWLVSKENFTIVSTEIEAEKLQEKIEKYLELLSADAETKQAETNALGRELYNLLVSPVADRIDPVREICLVPHKSLFNLPFAALLAPDGRTFLAQFNFFYAPSANVFLICTENAERKTGGDETLLSIGNPHFDRREFENLANLPAAESEARAIARFYPQTRTFIGAEATKAAVQNSLQNAEIIHFAGHYLAKYGEPLSSSLILAKAGNAPEENLITNAELIRQKLPQAKLVVLSACQTGVEQYYNGEGMIGLSRTFLAAGAPLVVASHWQVDSEAASELMKKFHFHRKAEKLSTPAALRRAQLEMLNAPDGRFRRPYFWAAFAAFGGYAEF